MSYALTWLSSSGNLYFSYSNKKGKTPLVNITNQEVKENKIIMDYEIEVPVIKAKLIYTETGIDLEEIEFQDYLVLKN